RGLAVDAVAQELGRAPSTVWGYLADWVASEADVDLAPWVPAEAQARVRTVLMASEDGRLKPVFDALGGSVPYAQIRLVAAACEARHRRDAEA
ncbi:MAG: helix-turn-helix domain-containing protein, partial [Planctomycetes bacterium]|nr:helix-turn-helix domain-containing protein [Planctomycetota bacterium]